MNILYEYEYKYLLLLKYFSFISFADIYSEYIYEEQSHILSPLTFLML